MLDAALAHAEAKEKADGQPSAEPDATPAPPPELSLSTDPEPKKAVEPKTDPTLLPIGPVVLPSLAPAPKPDDAPAETLKASATSVLDRPKEKTATPPRPINPDRPAEPAASAESWSGGLERLRRLVRAQSADRDDVWRLRGQLLGWLDETAGESDPGTLWRTVKPDDAEDIRRVVRLLEAQAPLEITDLRLCRKVNGFGSFEPIDPSACKPGQAVIVYCEMAGLHYEEAGEMVRSRLSSQVEIVSSRGGKPIWDQTLGTADDLCRRRRRDYYVCYRITLPETLAAGSYEFRLTQEDLVAGRSTSLAIPLTIQP
jgi:hypothetical protein